MIILAIVLVGFIALIMYVNSVEQKEARDKRTKQIEKKIRQEQLFNQMREHSSKLTVR